MLFFEHIYSDVALLCEAKTARSRMMRVWPRLDPVLTKASAAPELLGGQSLETAPNGSLAERGIARLKSQVVDFGRASG